MKTKSSDLSWGSDHLNKISDQKFSGKCKNSGVCFKCCAVRIVDQCIVCVTLTSEKHVNSTLDLFFFILACPRGNINLCFWFYSIKIKKKYMGKRSQNKRLRD